MPRQNAAQFVNVDEVMAEVTLDQVAAYYGVALPELHRAEKEVRSRCFLNCGRTEETGDRALAIQAEHRAKIWRCHQYGCGKGGNLVSLCDLLKPGTNAGGKPRGQRFKEIAADLSNIARGEVAQAITSPACMSSTNLNPSSEDAKKNTPLRVSNNERARALVELDQKFSVEPAEMSPAAASYFRRRPFLTPAMCRKWRVGYLPRDGGRDTTGGTMRGRIVYPLLSQQGDVLTWFGRDPLFEEKHRKWTASGRDGREPAKMHFVKGFHRGLELFGQQASRLNEPGYKENVTQHGVIIVEGPNDVIALDALGVPAVAVCSNTITKEQAGKVASWAKRLSAGLVTVMFDTDQEGERGAEQALVALARAGATVRLGWNREMDGARFAGREPESLTAEEWGRIRETLRSA